MCIFGCMYYMCNFRFVAVSMVWLSMCYLLLLWWLILLFHHSCVSAEQIKPFFGILISGVGADDTVAISAQRPFFLVQIVGPTSVRFKKSTEQVIAHIADMCACVRAHIFVRFLFVLTFFNV